MSMDYRSGSRFPRPAAVPPPGARRPRPPGRPARAPRARAHRGGRPAPGNRRPAPAAASRRAAGKPSGRFYLFIALAAIVVVALAALIAHLAGGSSDPQTAGRRPRWETALPTADPALSASSARRTPPSPPSRRRPPRTPRRCGRCSAARTPPTVTALSEDEMTEITDLSVTQGLPSEWMNILLLGSDERTLSESARTDSMIICSINTSTGEVKLTSIMRDVAVYLDEIGAEYARHLPHQRRELLRRRGAGHARGQRVLRHEHRALRARQLLRLPAGGRAARRHRDGRHARRRWTSSTS